MIRIGTIGAVLGRIALTVVIVTVALAETGDAHARTSMRRGSSCVPNERSVLSHPVRGAIISGFGLRLNPLTGRLALHSGIDYRVPAGGAVRSAGIGRVTQVGRRGPGDLFVAVDHGGERETRYSHLGQAKVRVGICVRAGSVLGAMGSRHAVQGRQRLHVETRRDGILINPLRIFGRARMSARP